MRLRSSLAFTLASCSAECRRRRPCRWTLRIEPLASPAGDATAQPQLTASSDGVILSWLENTSSQTALKFSERTAAGWSEPRLVTFGDDFFANYADVPSVVRLRRSDAGGALAADERHRRRPATICVSRDRPTRAGPGRRRFRHITTAPKRNTASRRSSTPAAGSGWSGSTAAR